MTCSICDHKDRATIDEAIKARSGWKRLAKAYKVTVPQLMIHKGHVVVDTMKRAVQRVTASDRARARRGSIAAISLETIARKLNKLAIAAEASGNSGDAIKALAALQNTLQQMRESGHTDRKVEIRLNYHDAIPTNPRPALVRDLKLYIEQSPPEVELCVALLDALEPPPPKIKVLEGPRSLQ